MGNKYTNLEFLMKATKNDEGLVKEYIHDVLELNTTSVSSLVAYFHDNNYVEMKNTAHMLKSSADIFDSVIYKEKLVALEHTCLNGDRAAIEKALKELSTIATDWEAELREELLKLS
jgi:hypothetical protein